MRRGRWYMTGAMSSGEQGPVQVNPRLQRRGQRYSLPMPILAMAADEYNRHHDQSLERLNERGGLGILEVVALLADRCERLSAPKAPPLESLPEETEPE